MRQLGFTEDEMDDVFTTTAACLHLGNLVFGDDGKGGSVIKNEKGWLPLFIVFCCHVTYVNFSA